MKKGFTLAELLGVIIVLGIIATIVTPLVTSTIKDSKEKAYDKQVEVIESSAKQWGLENVDSLPTENEKEYVFVDTLINSGKIQNTSIINPKTNEEMTGCVVITYNSEYNQYEYKYDDDCTICKLVKAKEEGNVYSIGSKYECTVKTGETQIFYVLEDGDTTELTPETGGIATQGKVSLIMDRNIDKTTVAWNSTGSNSEMKEVVIKLASITAPTTEGGFGWDTMTADEVSLPTANQIAKITNPNTWDSSSSSSTGFNFGSGNTTDTSKRSNYAWLYNYTKTCTSYGCEVGDSTYCSGYWTSTPRVSTSLFNNAWLVVYDGAFRSNYVDIDRGYGLRPVITISKSKLS